MCTRYYDGNAAPCKRGHDSTYVHGQYNHYFGQPILPTQALYPANVAQAPVVAQPIRNDGVWIDYKDSPSYHPNTQEWSDVHHQGFPSQDSPPHVSNPTTPPIPSPWSATDIGDDDNDGCGFNRSPEDRAVPPPTPTFADDEFHVAEELLLQQALRESLADDELKRGSKLSQQHFMSDPKDSGNARSTNGSTGSINLIG